MPAQMHWQREAAAAFVTLQRPIGHGDARGAHGFCRLFIPEEAANRLGLSLGDAAATDSGQACVFAFLPGEFFRELHS